MPYAMEPWKAEYHTMTARAVTAIEDREEAHVRKHIKTGYSLMLAVAVWVMAVSCVIAVATLVL